MNDRHLQAVNARPERVGVDGLLDPEVIEPTPLLVVGASLLLAIAVGVGGVLFRRVLSPKLDRAWEREYWEN